MISGTISLRIHTNNKNNKHTLSTFARPIAKHIYEHLIQFSQQPQKGSSLIISILQMRKSKFIKIK